MSFVADGKKILSFFKGLPPGSSLSPFSYSFYTSEIDRCFPENCSLMQYAKDLEVYSPHYHSEGTQRRI
jgi:hypothetical protein